MENPYLKYVQQDNPYQKMASGETEDSERKALVDKAMANGWGSGVPAFVHELGGKVTDLTGSPLAGAATNFLANAIPSLFLMTKGMPAASPEQAAHSAAISQKGNVLAKGRALGLKVPPSQVNPSLTNRTLESISGKASTAQKASEVNQDVAYAIAQKEAGLSPSEPIVKEALKAARDRLAQPYRDIAAIEPVGPLSKAPFKSPQSTLKEISEARQKAKDLWVFYNKSGRPSIRDKALEMSAKADGLEQTLEVYANQAGRPDLIEKLRQARTAIAKNYTVERAMRGSSFDPSALARLESRGKTPLSGNLETLMQMYRDFPKAMNPPQVGGSVGVNQLMPWLGGAGGGALGATLGGTAGAGVGAPAGVMLAQTLPPLTRSLILSEPYQALMANAPQGGLPSLLRMLANPSVSVEAEGVLSRP